VPHLLWHGASVFFRSHLKDRPDQSPRTTRKVTRRTYSNPDPHGPGPWGAKHGLNLQPVTNDDVNPQMAEKLLVQL
jgi:hypothetical protein